MRLCGACGSSALEMRVYAGGFAFKCCTECGSRGPFVPAGAEAYRCDDPEGSWIAEVQREQELETRARPDFDPRIDYPERYVDGPV